MIEVFCSVSNHPKQHLNNCSHCGSFSQAKTSPIFLIRADEVWIIKVWVSCWRSFQRSVTISHSHTASPASRSILHYTTALSRYVCILLSQNKRLVIITLKLFICHLYAQQLNVFLPSLSDYVVFPSALWCYSCISIRKHPAWWWKMWNIWWNIQQYVL